MAVILDRDEHGALIWVEDPEGSALHLAGLLFGSHLEARVFVG